MYHLYEIIHTIPHITINIISLQHLTEPLTDTVRILHTIYISSQLDPWLQTYTTRASPPIITIFYLLDRVLNIPSAHNILTYTLPLPDKYLTAYTNATAIYPCPLRYIIKLLHPILYHLCTQFAESFLLRTQAHQQPPILCPSCNMSLRILSTHIPCHLCTFYALIT